MKFCFQSSFCPVIVFLSIYYSLFYLYNWIYCTLDCVITYLWSHCDLSNWILDHVRSIIRSYTNKRIPKTEILSVMVLRRKPIGYRWQKGGRSTADVIMFGIQFGGKTKAIPSDSWHNHWGNRPPKGFLIVIKITTSNARLPVLPKGSVRKIIM